MVGGHAPTRKRYSFEQTTEEREQWWEEHPDPSGYELAERVFRAEAAYFGSLGDLDRFGESMHCHAVGGKHPVVSLRQAARLALPLADEVLEEEPEEFGRWVERFFISRGLEREEARRIVAEGRAARSGKGAA